MIGRIIEITWRTLVEVYKEFSLETSIHGIKYTTTARSTFARFFWVITLTLSVLAAHQLASLFYERHEAANVATLIIDENFPTWSLTLPAITLCPGTIAVAQKVMPYLNSQKHLHMPRGLTPKDFETSMKRLREALYPKNYFPDELDRLQLMLSANNISLVKLFENVSQNCSDFLLICQFEGQSIPCEELMRPVVTPFGICCSFNYDNSYDTSSRSLGSKEYKSAYFGDNFILSFLVRSVPSRDRIAPLMYGDGIKVLIHERYTHPSSTAVEFSAATSSETIAYFNGIKFASSAEILSLSPRKRGCFFSSKQRYREDNCYLRCRDTTLRKLCGCISFSATFLHNQEHMCNMTHIPCIARVILQIDKLMLRESECNCLPACEGIMYRATITALPLTATKHAQGELYDMVDKYEETSVLHFSLAGQSTMLQQRELILSNVNLVSSLGGVFGLFLGCSVVSLIEIFYFFCICFIRKLKFNLDAGELDIKRTK